MQIVDRDVYLNILNKNKHHIDNLYKICLDSGEKIEGNCFYQHDNINNRLEELIPKQMNLFTLASSSTNIMEIGFNAGHSALLFLIANSSSNIIIFDICHHRYVVPCFDYLNEHFPNRLSMFSGDSTLTVPKFHKDNPAQKFDLIHVDGCHHTHIANRDFFNSYKMASNYIIFDDTTIPQINSLFDAYLKLDIIREVFLHKTFVYEHRVGQVV